MSDAPSMNRHVPRPPELVNIVRVPPIAVKVPVCKLQNLTEEIEERMECQVESTQPNQVIWDLKSSTVT